MDCWFPLRLIFRDKISSKKSPSPPNFDLWVQAELAQYIWASLIAWILTSNCDSPCFNYFYNEGLGLGFALTKAINSVNDYGWIIHKVACFTSLLSESLACFSHLHCGSSGCTNRRLIAGKCCIEPQAYDWKPVPRYARNFRCACLHFFFSLLHI